MSRSDSTDRHERFGWRTFRLPPASALIFGAVYGAIAGAFIAWDVAVVIRGAKIIRRRIAEEIDERRGGD